MAVSLVLGETFYSYDDVERKIADYEPILKISQARFAHDKCGSEFFCYDQIVFFSYSPGSLPVK